MTAWQFDHGIHYHTRKVNRWFRLDCNGRIGSFKSKHYSLFPISMKDYKSSRPEIEIKRVSPMQLITSQKSNIPISIDISIKTHQFALGWLKRILDIIWPLNQHFKLKNQRNWLKKIWVLKFWSVINCIFVHWTKKLTLSER